MDVVGIEIVREGSSDGRATVPRCYNTACTVREMVAARVLGL